MTYDDGDESNVDKGDYTGHKGDGSLSVGQKSVMTVICWTVMAAPRNVTRRWTSNVMVSDFHSLQGKKKNVPKSLSSCEILVKQRQNLFLIFIHQTHQRCPLSYM